MCFVPYLLYLFTRVLLVPMLLSAYCGLHASSRYRTRYIWMCVDSGCEILLKPQSYSDHDLDHASYVYNPSAAFSRESVKICVLRVCPRRSFPTPSHTHVYIYNAQNVGISACDLLCDAT